jgi:hypothetical protein
MRWMKPAAPCPTDAGIRSLRLLNLRFDPLPQLYGYFFLFYVGYEPYVYYRHHEPFAADD